MKRALLLLTAALSAAVVLAAGLFLLIGGRISTIETPSMATYAPVGSLVLTLPVTTEELQAGDTVLFTPPGSEQDYFHRVAAIDQQGVQTQGDLNGTIDPWVLQDSNILGKEFFHGFGLGYLFKILPIIAVGGVLFGLLAHFYLPRYWKLPVALTGSTLIFSLANYLFSPFVKVVVLSQVIEDGVATTTFVPTGLWKVDGAAYGGSSVLGVNPGEVGLVTSSKPDPTNHFSVDLGPHMTPAIWALMIFIWLIPTLLTLGYFFYARAKGLDTLASEAGASDGTDASDEESSEELTEADGEISANSKPLISTAH